MSIEAALREDTSKLRVSAVSIDTDDPIVKPIFEAMKDRGSGPLNIHRVMACAPAVYRGFAAFAAGLREPGATSRADRELVILRTTQIKCSEYEHIQHKRIGLSVGLSQEQIDRLDSWRDSKAYDNRQRLLLELTDGLVIGGRLSAEVAERAERSLTSEEIVEVVMSSALYVAVALFTHAICVEPETVATSYGES